MDIKNQILKLRKENPYIEPKFLKNKIALNIF